MKRHKGFTSKINNLNPEMKSHLDQLFGINRFVWNLCLAYRKEIWETYKRRNPCVDNKEELEIVNQLTSDRQLKKDLAKKRIENLPQYKFILSCPANAVQLQIKSLINAYTDKTKSFPKFKKKNDINSIKFSSWGQIRKFNKKYLEVKTNGMTFVVRNPEINNKKIFDKETKITYITLSKKRNGEYFVSVNYSYEINPISKKVIDKAIGIDRGVNTTVTCSNEEVFNIDQIHMDKINDRIKFYQKQLFKKKKGSKNRNKIRMKIAKLWNKKSNIKKDFNHKLSHYLVKNHDLIVMEDLSIRRMTTQKNESNLSYKKELNRLILENNWWQLKHFIEYKCEWYGKHFVLINPKNTSRKCSKCSHTEKDNRKNKKFHCLSCGHKMDADLNASINILEAGLALIACGDYHISDSMKQELEKITSK